MESSFLQPKSTPIETPLERAGAWFLLSGIQEANGGVARYYHSDTHRNARVSTEITGYAVSAFCYLHERSKEPAYLDAAFQAGQFLTRIAWNPQLRTFPFEHIDTTDAPQYAYFFDCGIIVRGLVRLWRASGRREFLDTAASAALSMAHDFAASETFHPILSLPDKQPLAYQQQWSRRPGCYQLKSALAWKDLFDATSEQQYRDWYERALSAALASESEFLPAPEGPEKTMDRLHAYCYFLEGLIPAADREDCRIALVAGIERVSHYLQDIEPVFARSDVYAQLLRARLLAHTIAAAGIDREAAAREAQAIELFQCDDFDSRIAGGYYFGSKNNRMLPFVNPVSTAFCLQALEMWNDFCESGLNPDRHILL